MSIDYEKLASEAAGNWRKFDSFGWGDQPADDCATHWTLVYTSNRDSGLLDLSNAAAIDKEMAPFVSRGTAVPQRHNHWAVGYVDGYAIRVYRKSRGKGRVVTAAFRAWCDLAAALEDYPVLDEDDHSRREYEATCENISSEGHGMVREGAPEDWTGQVFSWLWEHDQRAVEPVDDSGGYPTAEQIRPALVALDLLDLAACDDEVERIILTCKRAGIEIEALLEGIAGHLDAVRTDTPETMREKLAAGPMSGRFPWHNRAAAEAADRAADAIRTYLEAAYSGEDTRQANG